MLLLKFIMAFSYPHQGLPAGAYWQELRFEMQMGQLNKVDAHMGGSG